MKKIIFIFFLLLTSCGYQSIYSSSNVEGFTFKVIEIRGDDEVNNRIINSLSLKQDENILNDNKLVLESNFKVEEILKNTKGQVISYKSRLDLNFIIMQDMKVSKNKKFIKEFTYNSLENKFDLVEYQRDVKINITNEIIEEIKIFLNL